MKNKKHITVCIRFLTAFGMTAQRLGWEKAFCGGAAAAKRLPLSYEKQVISTEGRNLYKLIISHF